MIKIIIGAQWGDEGKGRIVDALTQNADMVVRYQGGNNAGHTVVVKDNVFRLHLLPSGVVSRKRSLIASGVVIDPGVLCQELDTFEEKGQGIDESILGIDFRTHIIMPWHCVIDQAREELKGKEKIGTTGRGIGPVYESKAARTGIRFEHLIDEKMLKKMVYAVYPLEEKVIRNVLDYKGVLETSDEIIAKYSEFGERLAKYECDASLEVSKAMEEKKNVIFEGAQGTMLDNNFGTYPFVTSSQPIAGGVSACVGIDPKAADAIEGVAKAYLTRVGAGPFPSEIPELDLAHHLREKGSEYGTTTGRARRIGWFDSTVIRLAKRLNGLTGIHLTKLDVLGGLERIKIAKSHAWKGHEFDYLPTQEKILPELTTNYIEMPGFPDHSQKEWGEVVEKSKELGFGALPENARAYVKKVEELCKVPIISLSIGAERTEIIFKNQPKGESPLSLV